MEEGGRLSSTGPRRERVLPVQVDSRRSTPKSDSRSASCRIGACVQRAQSNDRAWSTRVVRDRSVTNLRVGALGASFDCRVAPGDCSPEALTRTGLGGFHHPALPLMWLMAMRPRFARESEARGSTTFRISGDMSPDVNAPVMGPFESSHQHGPPLLGRVRGPTRSPTSSLVCSPPTPSRPSAAAPVVPGRWPTLSLVRQGGRRASQVPGPSSSSVP